MVARLVRDQKAAGSNPATSTPRDIVKQCSRGFAFPVGFPILSGLQPTGLQRGGEAPIWQRAKITSGNFRKFPFFPQNNLPVYKSCLLSVATLIFSGRPQSPLNRVFGGQGAISPRWRSRTARWWRDFWTPAHNYAKVSVQTFTVPPNLI